MQCFCTKNAKKRNRFFVIDVNICTWALLMCGAKLKKEKKIVLLTSSLCFIVYKLFYLKNVDNQTAFWRKIQVFSQLYPVKRVNCLILK